MELVHSQTKIFKMAGVVFILRLDFPLGTLGELRYTETCYKQKYKAWRRDFRLFFTM